MSRITINQAIALLQDDNLVWSEDMEDLRRPLANLMRETLKFEQDFGLNRKVLNALTAMADQVTQPKLTK